MIEFFIVHSFIFHSSVIYRPTEIGSNVVMIHQLTFADKACGMTDGVAVLDNVLALGNITKGKLMACRDAGEVLQRHCHCVGRIDLKELFQLINGLTNNN